MLIYYNLFKQENSWPAGIVLGINQHDHFIFSYFCHLLYYLQTQTEMIL